MQLVVTIGSVLSVVLFFVGICILMLRDEYTALSRENTHDLQSPNPTPPNDN